MFIVWGKDAELGPTKIIKHHHSVKKFQTPSVSRRNARERNRVKQVNSGFCILKDHVPHLKNKTSKVIIIGYKINSFILKRFNYGEKIYNYI